MSAFGATPLIVAVQVASLDTKSAAQLGRMDDLTALVAVNTQSVHLRAGDGQTPLHVAPTVAIAEFLLGHGADIDAGDVDHESTPASTWYARTPTSRGSYGRWGKGRRRTRWLASSAMRKCFDCLWPAGLTRSSWRQLPFAAQNDNVEAVRMMLAAGWPIGAVGQHGATALHWAGFHGNAAMARVILAHHPPLEAREKDYGHATGLDDLWFDQRLACRARGLRCGP